MKFFSINRSHALVLTTLLVVIALGAIYLFIYLPHNEKNIEAQRFRVLQNIDENIHAKIENSVALLNNLLTAFQTKPSDSNKIKKYIDRTSKENFILIPRKIIPRETRDSLNNLDSVYTLEVNNNTRQIILFFTKQYIGPKKDTIIHGIGMKFSFEQFVSFLLPKNVFDEYIIFSKDKPVYQSFPAGISYVKEDSLLGIKNGMSASGVRNFNISGKEFKLFLQPVSFSADKEWIIGGLLSKNRYENEKKRLPAQSVLLLVTLALCIIVALPWIKLFQMGNKDRLTVADGIYSILISMLLVSFLFLAFFKYNIPFRSGDSSDSKTVLARSLSGTFKQELAAVYEKLYSYDELLKDHTELDADIILLKDSVIFYDNKNKVTQADTMKALAKDISINHLFWLDENGNELIKWTVDSIIPPHGNFKAREYFKNIKDKKTYNLDGDTSKKFYIDQVISWTNGAFTSVLSIPSQDPGKLMAAISFKMRSLENVVLPAGYQFALIDSTGKVVYHSQSSHNLTENLLDKFSEKNKMVSSLQSHTESSFATEYFSREYLVKIMPLTGLPYYIVILSDTGFRETRDMEIYSFTFSMLVLFFAFLILQLFIIFLVSAKRSFFKKQLFDTSWVGPKNSGHHEYILSAVFNFIVIFLLIIFFSYPSFLTYLFILLFSTSFLTLFFNSLLYKRYKIKRSGKYRYKLYAIAVLAILILLIDFAAGKILESGHFWFLAGYELFLFIAAFIIYKYSDKIIGRMAKMKKPDFFSNRKYYIRSFTMMGVTRLIVTSGIPIVFFYIASYNYEQNIAIRYKESEFAKNLVEKFPYTDTSWLQTVNPAAGIHVDSSWIKPPLVILKKDLPQFGSYSPEEKMALKLLGAFRLNITDEAVHEKNFYLPGAGDSAFFYNNLLNDACRKDTGTVMYSQTHLPGQYLKITSSGLNYKFPLLFKVFKGFLFWLLLFLALYLFYIILKVIIKKLFAIKIPDISIWKELDKELLINNELNKLVFVIGVPGAKKKNKILEMIKEKKMLSLNNEPLIYDQNSPLKSNVFVADLINIPDTGNETEENTEWKAYKEKVLDKKNKLIIVNHFEYNILDPLTNRVKLNFLESLMLKEQCKIIILSTVHPVAFLDSIFFQAKQQTEKSANAEVKSVPGEDLERWHVLLGHYPIVLLPLEPYLSAGNIQTITLPADTVNLKARGISADDAIEYKWTKVSGPDQFIFVTPEQAQTAVTNLVEGEYIFELEVTDNQQETQKDRVTVTVNTFSPLSHSSAISLENHDTLEKLICNETERTHFLNKMRPSAIKVGEQVARSLQQRKEDLKPDELAFKLQVTAHYFYMYIWQSLTKEEKFLLYDLAEDNLVNSFDDYNLSMLIGKGIIIREDGTLKLFNKSFRNFILTAIGNTEAMKIKDQIRDNGNWGKWKTPLIIISIAILAFLLVSQEEIYSKLLTYVVALGAAIPAFLKLLSFFDKNAQKPN